MVGQLEPGWSSSHVEVGAPLHHHTPLRRSRSQADSFSLYSLFSFGSPSHHLPPFHPHPTPPNPAEMIKHYDPKIADIPCKGSALDDSSLPQ